MFKIDFSYFDYDYGTWANSNCSDPKKLYEAIVFKPEDIIKTIKIWYWTKSNVSEYSSPPPQINLMTMAESGLFEGGEPGDPKEAM